MSLGRDTIQPAPVHAPWNRSATLALASLVLITTATLPFLTHPYYEPQHDASLYIITARNLMRGLGYTYLDTPFTIRPPGFPALLTPILALRGLDFQALHIYVSAFGIAAVALLFIWLRARTGNGLSFIIALALWLNPEWREMCNQVMSDIPGAALLLACLVLERWAARNPSWRRDVLLGAFIALSAYVRSMLVILLPALCIARAVEHWRTGRAAPSWLRFVRERLAVVCAATLLVLLPWTLRNAACRTGARVDQGFIHSYSVAQWHTDQSDPFSPYRPASEILARVPPRAQQILALLATRMQDSHPTPAHLAAGAIVLAVGLVVLFRRHLTAALFTCGAIAMLLVWYSLLDRLVLPIWLLAAPAAVEGLDLLLERYANARASRMFAGLLVIAVAIIDFAPRQGWERVETVHRQLESFTRDLQPRLPADARVAAYIGWHYAVFLDRPVYSLFFAKERGGGLSGVEAVIDKYRLDTVVMADFNPNDRELAPYFTQRHGVQERTPSGTIVKVRP